MNNAPPIYISCLNSGPTLFVFISVTVIVFLMIHLAPGEPLMAIMGPSYGRVSPEKRAEIRHNLGLDRPLHVQYVSWLAKALRGDFGRSLMMRQEISPMVWTRSRTTVVLAVGALVFAVPLGIIAGVAAAWRRNSFFSLHVGWLILEAAGLGFLGLGAQPPTAEWGAMLSQSRQYFTLTPHVVLLPGLCIFILVLGCNLFGEGLRDVLDPRLRMR